MSRNLNSYIPNAPNFKYGEFVRSTTALRLGITNNPTEVEWINIERLAVNVLQPIRVHFGPLRILSGYRSPNLNAAINGSESSNHCRGEAADVEPINSSIKLIDIITWAYRNLSFRECIAEYFPDGWIHLAYREGYNTQALKLKDLTHNYEKVTIDRLIYIYDNYDRI